jgi:hypothetical protein
LLKSQTIDFIVLIEKRVGEEAKVSGHCEKSRKQYAAGAVLTTAISTNARSWLA